MTSGLTFPFAKSLNDVAQIKALNHIHRTGKTLPATVTKVDGWIATMSFQMTDGYQLPQVTMPVANSEYSRDPVQVGDKGYVVPGWTTIGNMDGLGASSNPGNAMPNNLSALSFHALGNKQWGQPDDPNAHLRQGPKGTVSQDMKKKSQSKVHPDDGVQHAAGNTNNNVTPSGSGGQDHFNARHQTHKDNGVIAEHGNNGMDQFITQIISHMTNGATMQTGSGGGSYEHSYNVNPSSGHTVQSSMPFNMNPNLKTAAGVNNTGGTINSGSFTGGSFSGAFSGSFSGSGSGSFSGGSSGTFSGAATGTFAGTASLTGALILAPQYAQPLTGATVTISSTAVTTIIDPAGTLAALTIALPGSPVDGQVQFIGFTQLITALTWSGGTMGANTPTAIASPVFALAIQYVAAASKWFVIAS